MFFKKLTVLSALGVLPFGAMLMASPASAGYKTKIRILVQGPDNKWVPSKMHLDRLRRRSGEKPNGYLVRSNGDLAPVTIVKRGRHNSVGSKELLLVPIDQELGSDRRYGTTIPGARGEFLVTAPAGKSGAVADGVVVAKHSNQAWQSYGTWAEIRNRWLGDGVRLVGMTESIHPRTKKRYLVYSMTWPEAILKAGNRRTVVNQLEKDYQSKPHYYDLQVAPATDGIIKIGWDRLQTREGIMDLVANRRRQRDHFAGQLARALDQTNIQLVPELREALVATPDLFKISSTPGAGYQSLLRTQHPDERGRPSKKESGAIKMLVSYMRRNNGQPLAPRQRKQLRRTLQRVAQEWESQGPDNDPQGHGLARAKSLRCIADHLPTVEALVSKINFH